MTVCLVGGAGPMPTGSRLDEHSNKTAVSTALHRVGILASQTASVAAVAIVTGCWVVVWIVSGQPEWMARALEMTAASVTLVMVFVIQHAQRRSEVVTQLKLDEVVRALPAADAALVKAEASGDGELVERMEQNLRYRNDLRNEG